MQELKSKIYDAIFLSDESNDNAFEELVEMDINRLAIAFAHFVFRNGPVEDMHADGKLGEEDMKTLNKFVVNRLAYLIELLLDEQWMKLYKAFTFFNLYGSEWDNAEPDDGGVEYVIDKMVERFAEELEKSGERTLLGV